MTDYQISKREAEAEFLYFWERSICADKMCRWWLARIAGRAA